MNLFSKLFLAVLLGLCACPQPPAGQDPNTGTGSQNKPGPADFSLSAVVAKPVVPRLGSTEIALTLTRGTGPSKDVTVTATGYPSVVIPAAQTTGTLTVLVPTSASLGSLSISLHATDGTHGHDATVSLFVRGDASTLDTTLGGTGWVEVLFGQGTSEAIALAVQPDGKWLVGGYSTNASNASKDFAVARYNEDGTLDASYGSDGLATLDLCGGDDVIQAMVLQPDGKLVVAGSAFVGTDNCAGGLQRGTAVARFGSDGKLDASFGVDGSMFTRFASGKAELTALALQPDGKLVAAGDVVNGLAHFLVQRYTAAGLPDSTWGTEGSVEADLSKSYGDTAWALSVLANGKVLVAGQVGTSAAAARFTSTGGLDVSFGSGGSTYTAVGVFLNYDPYWQSFPSKAEAVIPNADGGMRLLGDVSVYGAGDILEDNLTSSGAPDKTASTNNPVDGVSLFTPSDVGWSMDVGTALAEENGCVLVGGTTYHGSLSDLGVFESCRGTTGAFPTRPDRRYDFNAGTESFSAMALDPHQRLDILGVRSEPARGNRVLLARIWL